jgi:catechol 2,3-dioxygenase-like lactoylglutathione lyase family enzyme
MHPVTLGNHTATIAPPSQRQRIRRFFCDVLGAQAHVESDEVDRLQLGDFHLCFVYQEGALDESAFLKSTYLELKVDQPDRLRQSVLAFGVRRLEVPDERLYFQAPGGQVFRIVGTQEDLSHYEQSPSARPGLTYHPGAPKANPSAA